jgi:antitoxin (DNA-binding transcriptional repressor) of toxin-antitoxin stability system
MKVTATQLRQDIYNILDKVAQTGETVELERKGVVIRIIAEKKPSKLAGLKKRKESIWVGDRNDIFHMDYMEEWRKEWGIKE